MGSRSSIRAQVAVALALSLVLGAALNVVISAAVLRRVVQVQARRDLAATAAALARSIVSACEGRGLECRSAQATASSSLEFTAWATSDWKGPLAPGTAVAPFPDTGFLLVSAKSGREETRSLAMSLLAAYALLSALLAFVIGMTFLNRIIARPVDRLAAAAERIGRLELDDPLAGEAPTLGRLGIAFERMAVSLRDERARVTAQIAELERLNRQLAEARDSLVRTEKLATVGRLAAGVAHEVGNPLGAIFGYLELARSKAPAEVQDYLARIDREVARIDRTVRELLDFSRPGPHAGALGPVPLRDAVDSAVRLASVQKRLKHVQFDVDLAADLSILAEPHRLSQVLVNVLLNAGDAMKGDGHVVVRARRVDGPKGRRASDPPPGPRVEVTLADSGPGIAPADLPRIFDPFFTTKEPGEGTGLGLSICHRIMESFGGEIHATNGPERGAIFTLGFREALPAASERQDTPCASTPSSS